VGQFNVICFVDDLSLFTQSLGGAQALLNAIQEFELWCGWKVNRKKTCSMVIDRPGGGQNNMAETLMYMGHEVSFLAPSASCRYLGVWGTPVGDMSDTKKRILKKPEEARDLLNHHPLTPEQAIELFTSIGVGAFRYSAAVVPWTEKELERLETIWVQVMAQELCRHLARCLKHEDVVRQLTLRDLSIACDLWACASMSELTEEMELWKWDRMLSYQWARVAKCMQMLNIQVDMAGDTKENREERGTSWARATRELRRLRHRIEVVGGSKDQWEAGVWHMDKEQWDLLWTGEQAFWKATPHLLAAGHRKAEALMEPKKSGTGQPYKIQRLMAVQEEERTQTMRILLSRGVRGIDERTEGSHNVGSTWLTGGHHMWAVQSWDSVVALCSYTQKLEGEVSQQHPARVWVEWQEPNSATQAFARRPTTSECVSHLLQMVTTLPQGTTGTAEEIRWRMADPSKHPQLVCRGLARLLSHGEVASEGVRWLAKQIGERLPPGWGLCVGREDVASSKAP
jgi:hypothetical protein